MCKVKIGKDVQTYADLQNLITSVILRTTSSFTSKDIILAVQAKLNGSAFENKEIVQKQCDSALKYMRLSNNIRNMKDNRYCLTLAFPSYNPSRSWV